MSKSVIVNGSFADSLVRFRGDLLAELVRRGHSVHTTAPNIDADVQARLARLGVVSHSVPLTRAGLNPVSDLRYFRSLRAIFRDIKPAVVVNYTIKPNIWGSLAAASLRVPAVSMVTGAGFFLIEGTGWKRQIVQRVARMLYRAALSGNRAVVFQNPDDLADFLKLGLVSAKQVRLINGSGVNLDEFRPVELPVAPVFLMIARLLKTKGVGEFIAASAALKRQMPSARFLLVGMIDSGPDALDPTIVSDLGAEGIEYLGFLDDIRPVMARASVFVLPSYREGTPRSVLEAMAMGRSIVTTDVPGCRETIADGVNGILVPARDADRLQQAMATLASDAALRKRMGSASLDLVRKKFDVRTVNKALIQYLDL